MMEHEKAYLWRRAMGFSRRKLSGMTGFSESAIADIEAGRYRNTGHPIPSAIMTRYRTVCGAVTAQLSFDWFRAKLTTDERREIEFPVARQHNGDAP
jgi:transcriptional regulator with XRE-family HTH domain